MLRLVSSAARGDEEEAELLVGKGKGIQGKNNSCYADVSLMMLFAFRTQFDVLLTLPTSMPNGSRDSNSNTSSAGRGSPSLAVSNAVAVDEIHFFQHFVTSMIVNPLRRNGFVPYSHIMTLRSMISQLQRQECDNFVQGAQTEDVNVFLESVQHILCGGGAGAPSTPLADAARNLLDISVATTPVASINKKEEPKLVVTVAEVLAANALVPQNFSKPFFLNIPRSDNGLLPYRMVVPTLYLHPPNEGNTPQDSSGSPSGGGASFLELTAIVTFETSIQHYRGIFKRSCGSWVEYDSMGEVKETDQGGLEHLAVTVSANMQIFEDLERDPVLRAMCCDYLFPTDDFDDFVFDQVQSSPQRKAHQARPAAMDDVSRAWSIFRQAARRPYLYMYSPRAAQASSGTESATAASSHPTPSSSSRHLLDQVPVDASLASRLLQRLLTLRSWPIAVAAWEQEDVLPLVPKPLPPVHGCPDCGTFFDTEAQFIAHMQSRVCVAQQEGPPRREPPRRPAAAIPLRKEYDEVPPHSSSPSSQHQQSYPEQHNTLRHGSGAPPPVVHLAPSHSPVMPSTTADVGNGNRRAPTDINLHHHHSRSHHLSETASHHSSRTATVNIEEWQCERCGKRLPLSVRLSHITTCAALGIHAPPRRR